VNRSVGQHARSRYILLHENETKHFSDTDDNAMMMMKKHLLEEAWEGLRRNETKKWIFSQNCTR